MYLTEVIFLLFVSIGGLMSAVPIFPKQNAKNKESSYHYTTHWFPQTVSITIKQK